MKFGPSLLQCRLTQDTKKFRANQSVPGARTVSIIDDIAVILPPELSLDMESIAKVKEWLQVRLGVEGISLNLRKLQALLADGVEQEHLTEEQRTVMNNTGLTVVRQGRRLLG